MPVANFDSRFESKFSMETEAVLLEEEMPFRILMLGDWAGDSRFFGENPNSRKPLEIDRDNFDDLIAKICPQTELVFVNTENKSLNISFESLDDFHPDRIFQKLPIFSELRDIRRRLKNPDTFNSAASEVSSWCNSETDKDSESDPEISRMTDENLLDSILDGKSSPAVSEISHKTELSSFISDIVSPYKVKTDLKEQSKLIGIVDEVASDLMRKILHHRDFQSLESAWRGLYFLIKNIDTRSDLKIYLFQLSKNELSDNLSKVNSLGDSIYFRIVNEKFNFLPDNEFWAFVSGNYDFQINVEDIATLIRISEISKRANTPFISNINPKSFGFSEENSERFVPRLDENSNEQKLWLALRSIPTSDYIGLAMPRFIGRFPYGAATDPAEVFDFEEFNSDFTLGNYLWIPAGFAYSLALAQEFQLKSWNINADKSFEVGNLPLHIHSSQNSTFAASCVDIALSESDFTKILEQGVMPIISFRNSDSIRLSVLRSVSLESPILNGKWSQR